MKLKTAFSKGWYHGKKHGEASSREAETAHPDMDYSCIIAYCQGSIDGAIGDRWRLDGMPWVHGLAD